MIGARGSVLVVEDEVLAAELMQAVVEREGFIAVICHGAAEARAAYAIERPVAVLLDWVLPDAPGTEVCGSCARKTPW